MTFFETAETTKIHRLRFRTADHLLRFEYFGPVYLEKNEILPEHFTVSLNETKKKAEALNSELLNDYFPV